MPAILITYVEVPAFISLLMVVILTIRYGFFGKLRWQFPILVGILNMFHVQFIMILLTLFSVPSFMLNAGDEIGCNCGMS